MCVDAAVLNYNRDTVMVFHKLQQHAGTYSGGRSVIILPEPSQSELCSHQCLLVSRNTFLQHVYVEPPVFSNVCFNVYLF